MLRYAFLWIVLISTLCCSARTSAKDFGTVLVTADRYIGINPNVRSWLDHFVRGTAGKEANDAGGELYEDAAITSITNIPALLCGVDSVAPVITLKNNGLNVLTSAMLEYSVNGGTPYSQPWSGSLQSGQTTTVALAPIPAVTGSNTLVARATAPNDLTDEFPENDAWSIDFTASVPAGLVSLILTLDDHGSDVTWELSSNDAVVLYNGGPYTDGHNGQTDSVAFCLTNGCYTFTILDAFGNGICCADGEGGYVIRDSTGMTYEESNGQYGDQNVDEFCLAAVRIPEVKRGSFEVFPNPNHGAFQVQGHRSSSIRTVRVLDALGSAIAEVPGGGQTTLLLDLDLPNGTYLVQLWHARGIDVARMVVAR